METLTKLVALSEGNPPLTVDSPHLVQVMRNFDVSFVVTLNQLLKQQFSCW